MIRNIKQEPLSQHVHPSEKFLVRTEKWTGSSGDEKVVKERAYTLGGDYIGPVHMAYELIVNRGIVPEKIAQLDFECAIGFCKDERAWYGWTEQHIGRFAIGTPTLEDIGDFDAETDAKKIPVKRIKTLDEAREKAIAFVREHEEASKSSLQILQEGGTTGGIIKELD